MRYALARVVLLLSVVLVLANAQCFARCLTQPVDNAAPPCHSHGKTQTSVPQHDVRPSSAATVQTTGSFVFVPVSKSAACAAALWFTDAADLRPPPLILATCPLPLRI